jgi:hypothetical protein
MKTQRLILHLQSVKIVMTNQVALLKRLNLLIIRVKILQAMPNQIVRHQKKKTQITAVHLKRQEVVAPSLSSNFVKMGILQQQQPQQRSFIIHVEMKNGFAILQK